MKTESAFYLHANIK